METIPWSRRDRIDEIRERIWSYMSPASRFEPESLLLAGALLGWPEGDVLRLGRLQFLLSDEIGRFLEDLPQLLRRLSTSSARQEQFNPERLYGPIQWSRTFAARATTGLASVYVTAPAWRVYQTPENEMLVEVLDAVVREARSLGWNWSGNIRSEPARTVQDRLADAERWQQSRMLMQIERVRVSPRTVMRIRSSRARNRYAAVMAAHTTYRSLVQSLDREAVRAAVEGAGLVTAEQAVLFELLCLFNVTDALGSHGWKMSFLGLFEGSVHVTGERADGRTLDLWYQSAPSDLVRDSRYRGVLKKHGFRRAHSPRPDLVLRWTSQTGTHRWLVGECKLSESQGAGHAARQALSDLLAYRRTFDFSLSHLREPYGLGIAWGRHLQPSPGAEIMLCTPDTIGEAIGAVVV